MEEGWGCVIVYCMKVVGSTIDPRIPTMLRLSTLGFHRPGTNCAHQPRSGREEGAEGSGEGRWTCLVFVLCAEEERVFLIVARYSLTILCCQENRCDAIMLWWVYSVHNDVRSTVTSSGWVALAISTYFQNLDVNHSRSNGSPLPSPPNPDPCQHPIKNMLGTSKPCSRFARNGNLSCLAYTRTSEEGDRSAELIFFPGAFFLTPDRTSRSVTH